MAVTMPSAISRNLPIALRWRVDRRMSPWAYLRTGGQAPFSVRTASQHEQHYAFGPDFDRVEPPHRSSPRGNSPRTLADRYRGRHTAGGRVDHRDVVGQTVRRVELAAVAGER